MRPREISWIRWTHRPTWDELAAVRLEVGKPKPLVEMTFEKLGCEMVSGPALYDNGVFMVVDSVKDLEYQVIEADSERHLHTVRTIPLDKYEAIRVADEMKEAGERADA